MFMLLSRGSVTLLPQKRKGWISVLISHHGFERRRRVWTLNASTTNAFCTRALRVYIPPSKTRQDFNIIHIVSRRSTLEILRSRHRWNKSRDSKDKTRILALTCWEWKGRVLFLCIEVTIRTERDSSNYYCIEVITTQFEICPDYWEIRLQQKRRSTAIGVCVVILLSINYASMKTFVLGICKNCLFRKRHISNSNILDIYSCFHS